MAFFKPASRKKVRGRIAFDGPAGSGKTFTALRLAHALGKKIAVINTEFGGVELYEGLNPDGEPWKFDVCQLADFSPSSYTAAILGAAQEHYDVLVIDSLSHAWAGVGGALELVDKKGGNKFAAWKDITPMHNRMVDALLRSPCHVIATMRSKMEYVLEEYVDQNGRTKTSPRKVGLAPIQRQGMEYEFDVIGDIDLTHTLTISKSRCPDIDGLSVVKPGADFFAQLIRWLNEGTEVDPGYYIASEDDLRRSEVVRKQREAETKKVERQQEAALKAAEKEATPKENVRELMARKAAERKAAEANRSTPGDNGEEAAGSQPADGQADSEGSDAGATTADAPSEPPFDTPTLSIDRLVSRIEEYGPRAFGDQWPDARAAVLKKRGVGRLKSLAVNDAESLLEKLMAKSMGLEQANGDVHARAAGADSPN